MPGPGRFYGPALADGRARRRGRRVAARRGRASACCRCSTGSARSTTRPASSEQSIDRPEHRRARPRGGRSAATVLLNATTGVLPFDPAALRTLAVIGPNADRAQIMGGGSASLAAALPDHAARRAPRARSATASRQLRARLRHRPGVPPLQARPSTAPTATPGFDIEYFAGPDPGRRPGRPGRTTATAGCCSSDVRHPDAAVGRSSRAGRPGHVHPDETGAPPVHAGPVGRARVFVDGELVLDGVSDPPRPARRFFGVGSAELEATVELEAGRPVELVVEYVERRRRVPARA